MIKALVFFFFATLVVDGQPVWQVRHSFAMQEDCFLAMRLFSAEDSGMVITGDCGGKEA